MSSTESTNSAIPEEADQEEIFVCRFCGAPSHIAPNEQQAPPDYCHPEDHGMTESNQGVAAPNSSATTEPLCGWCGYETNLASCPRCRAHKVLNSGGVWYKEHDTRGRVYRLFKLADFAAAKAMEQQLMYEYGGYYSGRFSVFKQGEHWVLSGSYGTSD
jgi:hypothetical protein